MAGNLQRGSFITIAQNALVSPVFTLGTEGLLALSVPTLDTCTFSISGAASGGMQLLPIYDETGVQVLTVPATTGLFTWGSKALADLAGIAQIQLGCSAAQSSAARVFAIWQKTEEK